MRKSDTEVGDACPSSMHTSNSGAVPKMGNQIGGILYLRRIESPISVKINHSLELESNTETEA